MDKVVKYQIATKHLKRLIICISPELNCSGSNSGIVIGYCYNSPVSRRNFPLRWAARTPYISLCVITTNCRLYSNISQIVILYKAWRYSSKFDSPKSFGVYYWCVKIPQCGHMEHGLKYIALYVPKHITSCTVVITPLLFRDKPLGVSASVKRVYWICHYHMYIS